MYLSIISRFLYVLFFFWGYFVNAEEPCMSSVLLDRQIGQMFIVGFRGTDEASSKIILEDIKKRHLGGVIVYDKNWINQVDEDGRMYFTYTTPRNIENPDQLNALVKVLNSVNNSELPLFIAIDQEGGNVSRLHKGNGFFDTDSHASLGVMNDLNHTYLKSKNIAKCLKSMGINLNFAPCVDLALNKENLVIVQKERSFGDDPMHVVRHARVFMDAHEEEGICCVLKHFPGHGSSGKDSHFDVPDISSTWIYQEIIPYKILIKEGFVPMIMTAHVYNKNLDPCYICTLSKTVITQKLRNELSFDGVVISDDIQMRALSDHYTLEEILELGINAGIDIFIIANQMGYNEYSFSDCIFLVKKLIQSGKIHQERIEESYERIKKAKAHFI